MTDITTDNTATRNNRLVVMMITGIPLTMILAATWLWYYVVQGDLDLVGALGTANRGTLVQPPRQVDEIGLSEVSGAPIAYADLPRKWTMVVPNNGAECAASCEQLLYLTRQIHIAMGKEFGRIGRLYLSEQPVQATELAVDALGDGHPAPESFQALQSF